MTLPAELSPQVPDACGVVVIFHPEPSVLDHVRSMVRECGHVIVVDNGSPEPVRDAITAIAGVELIGLGDNPGLAVALNRGAARAQELGYGWVVTFDQDSSPVPGMVEALWSMHMRTPAAAVIGPRIKEPGFEAVPYRLVHQHPRWPVLFQRTPGDRDLAQVTMVVTSGSLMELAWWRRLGGFDEGLFIDYIDIDYCLKVIRSGRRVAVAAAAILEHRLGHRQTRMLMGRDFRPMNHAPFRHYYMARNRVIAWRRHAWAVPHWAAFDLSFAAYNLARVLLFEDQRWAKLRAIVRGTWDGVRGRRGALQ